MDNGKQLSIKNCTVNCTAFRNKRHRRNKKNTKNIEWNKDKPFKWSETDRGDKYQCTSEYVYINASIYHKSLFMKAIRITRDNSYIIGNEEHRIIETSYWVSDYGRIITYVDWDGTKKASYKLDVLDYVQEISEEKYNILKKQPHEYRIYYRNNNWIGWSRTCHYPIRQMGPRSPNLAI